MSGLLSKPTLAPSFLFFISIFLFLLIACTLQPTDLLLKTGLITPTPTPDPFDAYRAILQPWARNDVETIGPLPAYHITAQLNPDGKTLIGAMQVTLPNPGPETVFRLYPNLDNYDGAMQVTTALVNGVAADITSLADDAAVKLSLPSPASPATIHLTFTTQLPGQRGRDERDYTLFGWDGATLSLPGFYPTLAVRQGNQWILDTPPPHGDVLFNDMALYQLDLTLPRDLVVVATGVTLNVQDTPDGQRTWRIAGGPLRDMTVIAGPFQAISESAAGATVTSYYLPGDQAGGTAALSHATAALRLYSDLHGPYPYTELDVVEAPLNVRGMEYSGLALIGEDLYRLRSELTFLVAHEVAHQWWYSMVGNNPYQSPWLDEGLTEYSAFEYYQSVFGPAEAEQLLTGRWLIPFEVASGGGIEGRVDRPAGEFDPASYELLVYTKAALFFHALRQQLGEKMYRQVIQTYYAENHYRIVTPQTFLVTAQRVSGQNLNPLAEEWLR
ncbi:MAG: M1 family metallopeptidase [Anaerolineae bacterium]